MSKKNRVIGPDIGSEEHNKNAADGLFVQIFIPLTLSAIFAFGMSCFLTIEYGEQSEWAAAPTKFDPYEVTATPAVQDLAPLPVSMNKTIVPQKQELLTTN